MAGLEPATFCSVGRCATNYATRSCSDETRLKSSLYATFPRTVVRISGAACANAPTFCTEIPTVHFCTETQRCASLFFLRADLANRRTDNEGLYPMTAHMDLSARSYACKCACTRAQACSAHRNFRAKGSCALSLSRCVCACERKAFHRVIVCVRRKRVHGV